MSTSGFAEPELLYLQSSLSPHSVPWIPLSRMGEAAQWESPALPAAPLLKRTQKGVVAGEYLIQKTASYPSFQLLGLEFTW